LEEMGHIDGEHAGHELRDGEEYAGQVYSETSVCKESVELISLVCI
jgi:hypothetical protein